MTAPPVPAATAAGPLRADLVLEGGGVRGLGLVGAVEELGRAGYAVQRVVGSSAGAVVAAVVAGLAAAGEPLTRVTDVAATLDQRRVPGTSGLGRVPLVGGLLSLLLADGVHDADYLERWLTGVLSDLGVRTFGDLRTGEEPLPYAYRLVVTTSDLSRRRLLRLPWDLPAVDGDADAFPVARAVRASAAIPFFFRPVRERGATWVDGGLLSDFPLELLDRPDAMTPRWPTFGVRLRSRAGLAPVTRPVRGVPSVAWAALETLLSDQDASYLGEPCSTRRTILVPAESVSVVDFDLDASGRERLIDAGRAAAREFLAGWDWAAYLAACRSGGRPVAAGPAAG